MHNAKLHFWLVCSWLVLLASCSSSQASNWLRWDANEFPEYFQGAFDSFGGGSSRHIVEYPNQDGTTNYTYSVYSAAPSQGYFHKTTSWSWLGSNSTLEFRLKVCSYCGDMSVCKDPNVQGAFSIQVFDSALGRAAGFVWRKTAAEKEERISASEGSATYVQFKNQNKFFTYRMFYDAVNGQAKLYYWNSDASRWDYLLTSNGFATTVEFNELWTGDWSASMAGLYEIDYQRWTNDGLVTRPEFCGDTGTVYLQGDLNRDCNVNMKDMLQIVNCWLANTEPGSSNCSNL